MKDHLLLWELKVQKIQLRQRIENLINELKIINFNISILEMQSIRNFLE